MTIPITQKTDSRSSLTFICLAFLGCGLITLSSLVKIPFYPVPFTLQTLAIFFLSLTQSPKQAFASVVCYLLCGSLGLPVFCGKSNPFWILGKCGGYLLAFPFAAYFTALLSKKWPPIPAMLIGQALIYLLGFFWLLFFFGPYIAFTKGVACFIPSDLLKIFIASTLKKWRKS